MRKHDKPLLLFLVCLALFCIHQFLERVVHIEIALLDNYLDPLLFMPVLLHLFTIERRLLTGNPSYRLPLIHVALYLGIVSVLAEAVFPAFNAKLVGDPLDVCLYILGAALYVLATFAGSVAPPGIEPGSKV